MEVSLMGGYRKGRKWTDEDLDFLKENYVTLGCKKCAEHLGATYHSTQAHARQLGLRMFRSVKWTDEEIQYLKVYFPTHLTDYCAKNLGRSWSATHKKANSLGLKPKWEYRYTDTQGYVVLCHNREAKILEHRFVMEQHLGRKLKSTEIVHHIDGNKQNNSIDNLVITNRKDHINTHRADLNKSKHKI